MQSSKTTLKWQVHKHAMLSFISLTLKIVEKIKVWQPPISCSWKALVSASALGKNQKSNSTAGSLPKKHIPAVAALKEKEAQNTVKNPFLCHSLPMTSHKVVNTQGAIAPFTILQSRSPSLPCMKATFTYCTSSCLKLLDHGRKTHFLCSTKISPVRLSIFPLAW